MGFRSDSRKLKFKRDTANGARKINNVRITNGIRKQNGQKTQRSDGPKLQVKRVYLTDGYDAALEFFKEMNQNYGGNFSMKNFENWINEGRTGR